MLDPLPDRSAQNDTKRRWPKRAITGDLCVEHHERICAVRPRVAALVWRRSVRAFGAPRSSADRQICSGASGSRGVNGPRDRRL
jgi:hypothetical protein